MSDEKIDEQQKYCINLWASNLGDGNKPEDYLPSSLTYKRTKHLIKTMKKLGIDFNNKTIHEMGCNVGRNLVAIKKEYPEAKLSGNDVNKKGFIVSKKFFGKDINGVKFTLESTQSLLEKNEHYDVLISMAHIMHLPHSVDNLLKTKIPKMCDIFIAYEPKDRKDLGKYIFARNLKKFFGVKPVYSEWRPVREINRLNVFDFR